MPFPNPERDEKLAWRTMYVLALLFLLSYIDRQLISLLVEPVKHDLALTDLQAGVVTGLAFAITYSTLAIPLAYLSDIGSRRKIIALGVVCWGALTVASGLANSFATLCLARMGVGVGEAALTPNGYALAAELFPAEKKSRAMSLFVFGSAVGAGASLLFGGTLIGLIDMAKEMLGGSAARIPSWRLVFAVVGLLTVVSVLMTKLIDQPGGDNRTRADGLPTAKVIAALWKERSVLSGLFIGVPLLNLVQFGIIGWAPTFFIRDHGWTVSQTGIVVGSSICLAGIAAVVFTMVYGDKIDRYQLRGVRGGYWLLVLSQFLVIPAIAVLAWSKSPYVALAAFTIWAWSTSLINVLAPVHLQSLVPAGGRAQSGALWLFVVNIVGIGLGPPLVALAAGALGDGQSVGTAMFVVGASGTLAGAAILATSLFSAKFKERHASQSYGV